MCITGWIVLLHLQAFGTEWEMEYDISGVNVRWEGSREKMHASKVRWKQKERYTDINRIPYFHFTNKYSKQYNI